MKPAFALAADMLLEFDDSVIFGVRDVDVEGEGGQLSVRINRNKYKPQVNPFYAEHRSWWGRSELVTHWWSACIWSHFTPYFAKYGVKIPKCAQDTRCGTKPTTALGLHEMCERSWIATIAWRIDPAVTWAHLEGLGAAVRQRKKAAVTNITCLRDE